VASAEMTSDRISLVARRRSLRAWLPAAAAVALALAAYLETRLWLIAKFPYFLDEGLLAFYAQVGKNPDERLISINQGVRPGLVWMTLAVMNLHISPLVAIRLVAALFGLIALAAGAFLAGRYAGRTAAAAFVVLALFTPLLFLYDSLGLRDPVIAGLIVAGFTLELELARRPRLGTAFLLGVTFAGVILVKESGKVALFLLPLSLAYFPFRSPRRVRLALAWAGNAAFALALGWVGTLPLRLAASYAQLGSTERAAGATRAVGDVWAHPLRYFNSSWPVIRGELGAYVTYPVIVLAVVGLALGLRRRPRFTAVVAIWAIAQLAAAVLLPQVPYPRYLVPAAPFILLLAAIGVDELVRLARAIGRPGRRLTAGFVAAGLLALVPALVLDSRISYDPVSAPYPKLDKLQYITGYASGLGIDPGLDELRVLAQGRHLVVQSDPGRAPLALYVLAETRGLDIEWVPPTSPDAGAATAALANVSWAPHGRFGPFHEIWRYRRPDHGVPLVIYAKR
jgi:hypothetical protein